MVELNPFFTPSPLPYGLPPFADITNDHYRPAFDHGFAEQLAEIAHITGENGQPTFENTLIALERSGQTLERVATVFFNKSSADSTDFTNELEEEIAPLLAAHSDAIKLDAKLYRRITTIRDQLGELDLDAESRYLVERYYSEFTLAGAGLDEVEKTKLREFNQKLSTLTTRFEKNLLADTNELAIVIDDVVDLDGLDAGAVPIDDADVALAHSQVCRQDGDHALIGGAVYGPLPHKDGE